MTRTMLLAATAIVTSLAAGPVLADTHKAGDPAAQQGVDADASTSQDLTTADKADDSTTTDTDQQADTQGAATTGDQAKDKANQQAMAGGQPSQGQIISTINTMDVERVRGLGDISADKVRVVKASGAAASDDAQGLDNAVERNQDQIAQLREAIEGNDTLSQALEDQGANSDDVIAAEIGDDESVTLYTQD